MRTAREYAVSIGALFSKRGVSLTEATLIIDEAMRSAEAEAKAEGDAEGYARGYRVGVEASAKMVDADWGSNWHGAGDAVRALIAPDRESADHIVDANKMVAPSPPASSAGPTTITEALASGKDLTLRTPSGDGSVEVRHARETTPAYRQDVYPELERIAHELLKLKDASAPPSVPATAVSEAVKAWRKFDDKQRARVLAALVDFYVRGDDSEGVCTAAFAVLREASGDEGET